MRRIEYVRMIAVYAGLYAAPIGLSLALKIGAPAAVRDSCGGAGGDPRGA